MGHFLPISDGGELAKIQPVRKSLAAGKIKGQEGSNHILLNTHGQLQKRNLILGLPT